MDFILGAYHHCKKIALGHYENFPVGSMLIPKPMRPAIWAIYAFARTADDFADEGYPRASDFATEEEWRAAIDAQKPERLEKLAGWRKLLKNCYESEGSTELTMSGSCPMGHGEPVEPSLIFIALQDTIERHQIPYELLNNLLIAFERDVTERRKDTWEEVLDYCHYSANPVGRLVLWVFGYRDEKLFELSDAICTGLQLANFWQDIEVDLQKDRVYVPLDFLPHPNPLLTKERESTVSLLQKLGTLTWPFFEKGFDLPFLVKGRLAWELKLTWLGGIKILEKACDNLEREGFGRPKIEKSDKISLLIRSFFAYNEWTLRKYRDNFNQGQELAQTITAKSKSNFAASFFFLRKDQRRAMEALYAFSREVDDAVDESASPGEAALKLKFWRQELDLAYENKATHPILQEISWAKDQFHLSKKHFVELLEGVEHDLHKNRYENLKQLLEYTYGVASTVGLLCMRIFEVEGESAEKAAVLLGRALQFTNILRDIRSDAILGRIYLPLSDLKHFSLSEQDVLQGRPSVRMDSLMYYEIGQTEAIYSEAFDLLKELPRRKVLAAWMMGRIYYRILKEIKKHPRLPLQQKVSLSRWAKIRVLVSEVLRSFFS
ncbi:MAG: squalene/phytoene synthase family protein [Deltaproteobacteria bacterium]|nr:squalene/phytoene synthase family protein [Deltaproteobacteria bacterium]